MGSLKAPTNLYFLMLGLERGQLLCEWVTEIVLTISLLTLHYSLAACNNSLC